MAAEHANNHAARANPLANVLGSFQFAGMITTSPAHLAQTILTAPAWARVGITAPNERLREQAAEELALAIVARLERPERVYDARQMALPL